MKNFEILEDIYFTEKYCFEKDDQQYDKQVRYFLAWVKNPRVKSSETELRNYKWLKFEEAIELATYQSTKEIIRKIENCF